MTYKVAPNPGAARSAKITVIDTSFAVEQQAASLPGAAFAGSIADLVAQANWSTTFTLINTGDASAQARLSLFNDAGAPQSLLVATATSDPVQGASFDRTLPPHAALEMKAAGPPTAPLITGSAQIESSGAVHGFAIFKFVPSGQEAAFSLDARHAKSYLLAFDNTADAGLGVSVANTSAQPASVNVVIRDHTGTQIANGSMTLPANGHTSFTLASQYPATADRVGTVEFISAGAITVLGLRTTPFTTSQGKSVAITAIPALSDIKPGHGSIAQISTGNGWETTFVLINAGTNPARADLRFLADDGRPLEIPVQYPLSTTSTSTNASAITQMLAPSATLLISPRRRWRIPRPPSDRRSSPRMAKLAAS